MVDTRTDACDDHSSLLSFVGLFLPGQWTQIRKRHELLQQRKVLIKNLHGR